MKNRSSEFTRGAKLTTLAIAFLLSACAGTPGNIGVRDGDLKPCPSSPNCVSSAELNSHSVAAFNLKMPPDQAILKIAQVLNDQPRVTVDRQYQKYIHAEFTSAVFRFVDDVEFYAHDDGVLSVRSASRIGYSDLGANRARVERLRVLFSEKGIIQ